MRWVVIALSVAGCGRLRFDPTTTSLEMPAGGQMLTGAIAPDGTWYAVAQTSEVFRSDDARTWTMCAPAPGSAIAVASDGTVYLATTIDVLASSDRCASWQPTGLGAAPTALATAGTEVYAGTSAKLFSLSSGATTWVNIATPIDNNMYRAIAQTSAGDLFVGTATAGVAVRPTGQPTWITFASGIASPWISAFAASSTKSYVITQTVGGTAGATSCSSAPFTSWTLCDGLGGFAIAVDPADPNHVFSAVYDDLETTHDGFATAALRGVRAPGMDAATVDDLRFVPGGGVVAFTERGVSYSADSNNLDWQGRNTGLAAWSVTNIVTAGDDTYLSTPAGVLHASTSEPFTLSTVGMTHNTHTFGLAVAADGTLISAGRSVRISSDRGATWQETLLLTRVDNYTAYGVAVDAAHAYVGTGSQIYSADPPYMTWTPHLVASGGARIATLLANAGALWAAGGGLFVSTDGAATFVAIPELAGHTCQALAALPDGGIAVGTANGIWISDPAESMFVDSGLHPNDVNGLALDGDAIYAATLAGVYASNDRGATWTVVAGTEEVAALSVVVEPNTLLIGTDGQGLVRVAKPR
jgi:hypothetical protein